MEDLTIEQVIQIGQMYFPEMDAEKIVQVFEEFKKILPEGTSNLEIVQVIKMAVDDNKKNPQRMGKLSELMMQRK